MNGAIKGSKNLLSTQRIFNNEMRENNPAFMHVSFPLRDGIKEFRPERYFQ